jgi:hypothetical protein
MPEYREIAGCPGYRVGDDGTVWSCRPRNGRGWLVEWRQLKPLKYSGGYQRVAIRKGRTKIYRLIHRLVLEAFVGPCPDGMECCHGPDHNPSNNTLPNLRWGTKKENQADRITNGTHNRGERSKNAKLTDELVREIRAEWARLGFGHQAKIAAKYGVWPSTISSVLIRRTWSHVS